MKVRKHTNFEGQQLDPFGTAIAIEFGILKPNQEMNSEAVVDGDEFGNYTPEKSHVVAVTGDGTNDAPTLKEADIGLSMGILWSEVARESSDIFILDDNFSFVATVLMKGRYVYNEL
ncbi:putative calcium-transporting ATPase 13, plasma membrane-type [Camellia lanceoleosa]|uniref:Calcium-transporting ATPase 13, plasma membrane-type n=1 Tax=Camellia lanceoleosa TaxID=1840588 RepID=A0ACC0H8Y4_9ERIC|nr:putative calcium-transporting ATPase 13, plasma membrane-type [Camellia lanceoleosa]